MQKRLRIWTLLSTCLSLAMFSSCGTQGAKELSSTEEAYRLMDQGDNAKAVLVLEQELNANPENTEARELLASAYVGLAGLDIYSIQESFQDVLFRRPLKEAIKNKNEASSKEEPEAPPTYAGERTFQKIDRALMDAQRAVIYLARFPQITEEKWVYLERALALLDDLRTTSDLAIYRILIRLTYMKSYLVHEVVRDEDFGTKHWACTFDIGSLRKGLSFMNEQLLIMRKDLILAVEKGATKLAKADGILTHVINATNLTESVLVLENSRTIQEGDRRLRNALGCAYAQ